MIKSMFHDFYDEDEYIEFIRQCEREFRSSKEYRLWIRTIDREKCAATGFSFGEDNADIEVHHYKRTLFDWMQIIVDYFIDNKIPVNTFFICLIITELHFSGCITYIPLLHCIHKMLHKGTNIIERYPHVAEQIVYGDESKVDNILLKYKKILEDQQVI